MSYGGKTGSDLLAFASQDSDDSDGGDEEDINLQNAATSGLMSNFLKTGGALRSKAMQEEAQGEYSGDASRKMMSLYRNGFLGAIVVLIAMMLLFLIFVLVIAVKYEW